MLRIVAGLAGLSVAAALALAAPATAQDTNEDTNAETLYSAYHRAIRAAALCEKRLFNQDTHAKMALYIDERINHALGAGRRLRLIEEAKLETERRVDRYGCEDPSVQESLALFHGELEPTLQ